MGAFLSGEKKTEKCYVCTVNHVDTQPSYFCTEQSMANADAIKFKRDWDKLDTPGGPAFLVPDRGLTTPWWKYTRWPYGTVNQCGFMRTFMEWHKEEREKLDKWIAAAEAQYKTEQRAADAASTHSGSNAGTSAADA
jgi:hypothetical protein